MFAADFLGNQIDAAMARMFSPLHKFLEMTEKRVAAQKEEDDYKRELQEKGVGERLRSDPMSIILEAKEVARALFKNSDIAKAAVQYKKCEWHCVWAIEHSSSDNNQTVEVKQQLSLCKLNRSLCYYKEKMYHESHELCMQVLDDLVSCESARCKAGVRAGQSLVQMYLKDDEEKRNPNLLQQALACADAAELLCNGEGELSVGIALLRKEAREKLVEAGFSPAVDPSTLPASLADLPPPIPPLLASALHLIEPLHPFPPHILSAAHRVFLRLRVPPPPTVEIPPLPPPRPRYPNYFQRCLMNWPQHSDGHFFTCIELQADIMSNCDYLLPLRAFAKHWLQQRLSRQRLPPPRFRCKASASATSGSASAQVKAAARRRARGGEVAFLSARLADIATCEVAHKDACKRLWAAAIMERVFSIHCMRIRVSAAKARAVVDDAMKRIDKKGPEYTIIDAARDDDVAFIQDLIISAKKNTVLKEPNHAKLFEQTDKENLKDAIYYAVRHGHLDVVRLCLSGGARMKYGTRMGCQFGGVRADIPNESLIHTAVRTGRLEMVQLLVAYGADVNDACSEDSKTPLKKAIEDKHTDIADYLRSAGGLEKSFQGAASDGDISLVQSWLLTSPKVVKQKRNWACRCAAEKGRLEVVRLLLAARVDARASDPEEGFTALHAAAKSAHLHVVQFLVSEGADVNAVALERNECYHTVLKEAIEGNTTRHRATAEYLRSAGAREHSLHGAVQDGNVDMIRDITLAHPDCVNKPLSETFSNGGDYPLHVAAFAGRLEVIQLLLHAGADVNIQSRIDGACALRIAAQAGNLQMVQLLVDSGANVPKDSLTWNKVSGPVADYLRSVEGGN